MKLTIHLEHEQATKSLAVNILKRLLPGDVLLLEGLVGAGKSALARAIIQAQMMEDGQIEDVPSPTFTLIQTYDTRRGTICHADLYRLSDAAELEELGLPELFDSAICMIEWPERLGTLCPERHLKIEISLEQDPDSRTITLIPYGRGWDWLNSLLSATED